MKKNYIGALVSAMALAAALSVPASAQNAAPAAPQNPVRINRAIDTLSKGGSIYSRTILGLPVRDLTSGYKAFTRRALEAIDLERVRSNGYSFQIEMTFRAAQRGMKVVEVPIVFVDRRAGQSKMSRKIFAEAIGVVWKLRYDAIRGLL